MESRYFVFLALLVACPTFAHPSCWKGAVAMDPAGETRSLEEFCCDTAQHGPRGNTQCWDRFFSYAGCCDPPLPATLTGDFTTKLPQVTVIQQAAASSIPPALQTCADVVTALIPKGSSTTHKQQTQLKELCDDTGTKFVADGGEFEAMVSNIALPRLLNTTDSFRSLNRAESAVVEYILDHEALHFQRASSAITRALALSKNCVSKSKWQISEMRDPQGLGPLTGHVVPVCVVEHLSKAVQRLKSAKYWKEARDLYEEAVHLVVDLGPGDLVLAVPWQDFGATPRIPFELEQKPLWHDDPRLAHVVAFLKNNYEIFKQELEEMLAANTFPRKVDAYKDLKRQGTWGALLLHSCLGGFEVNDGCVRAPKSCAALKAREYDLFKQDLAHCLNPQMERAGFLVLKPGTEIPWHSDTPSRINVHVCLKGCAGARLRIGGDWTEERTDGAFGEGGVEVEWKEGEVFAFQDCYDHWALHGGDETRFVFYATVAHPDWAKLLSRNWPMRGLP